VVEAAKTDAIKPGERWRAFAGIDDLRHENWRLR
jgi:hypothetical protein